MVEVTGVNDADRDADSTALGKLSEALGEPSQEATESAKALFPFIAFEAALDNEQSLAALEDRPSDSAGRHPAAPGR
ncbi:hypothetical protein [Streptomyces sp. NPDC005408]|uniref:hypothetical protein n=1 Tax=Streptomyces sp. NPDC005408 TaxID=3155341 RepID=UPI0033BDCD82